MLPFKSMIDLDRKVSTPLYLQLSNQMIQHITAGIIPVGMKLPGGRKMGEVLGLSRKTVNLAYEELQAQGWIEIRASQGSYISSKIPVTRTRTFSREIRKSVEHKSRSLFRINRNLDFLSYYQPPDLSKVDLVFDTGYPDVRMAPLRELGQAFSRTINSRHQQKILNYAHDFRGHVDLRKEIVRYLEESRGIKVPLANVMLTRGSLMAFTSIFQVLIKPGDRVAVGKVSFKVANHIIKIAQGQLVEVPVDDAGIDVDALERVCQKSKISAVFVMPHHHHPTTVSLSAERRMKLLLLAKKYRFAIVEDDYDYDFHYASSPLLPMASADRDGTVIYVGSLSKIVAPGLRIGFIVAPLDLIDEVARLSRFIDCHGNSALEKSIALLFREGIIRRHLKKSLFSYRKRRDLFCLLLKKEVGQYLSFDTPEGGLAVWVKFNPDIPLEQLRDRAAQFQLLISKSVFQDDHGRDLNAIRMGFASLNEDELVRGVALLKSAIEAV